MQQWGSLDGEVDTYHRVRALAKLDGGRLLIRDGERGLLELGQDGSVRVFARRGRGPGEFSAGAAIDAWDDLVAAWDAGNKRVTTWTDDGRYLTGETVPRFWSAYDESGVVITEAGGIWTKLEPDMSSDGITYPRARYVTAFRDRPDTIFVDARGTACDHTYDYTYRNGYWVDIREPWFPRMVSALDREGRLYVGCTDRFSIRRINADGSETVFERPDRNLQVTDDERLFFGAWQPPMGELPETRPEFSRIIPTDDGRVWVFETQEPEYWEAEESVPRPMGIDFLMKIGERSGRFTVFDPDGSVAGIVQLPEEVLYSGYPTTPSVEIRGDSIWAVYTGEFDEQYIGKYVVDFPERDAG